MAEEPDEISYTNPVPFDPDVPYVAPSDDEWRALYVAAMAFLEAAPWEKLEEDHIFAVEDPATGRLGYCTVSVDDVGPRFYMARGTLGLMNYKSGMYDEDDVLPISDAFRHGVRLVFGNRDEATKGEVRRIRDLGIKIPGKKSWPAVVSLAIGYIPRLPDREEAVWLTHALRQVVDVASRVDADPEYIGTPRESGVYLMRVVGDRDAPTWRDEYGEPATHIDGFLDPDDETDAKVTESLLALPISELEMEVGVSAMQFGMPRDDGGRLAIAMLPVVVTASGDEYDVFETDPVGFHEIRTGLRNAIAGAILDAGSRPSSIMVRTSIDVVFLDKFADAIGVKLAVGPTESLDEVRGQINAFYNMR